MINVCYDMESTLYDEHFEPLLLKIPQYFLYNGQYEIYCSLNPRTGVCSLSPVIKPGQTYPLTTPIKQLFLINNPS